MTQKPKIQYIGQFYIHGSEARALELEEEKKKAKENGPLARLQKIRHIYVDPVAVVSILVSVFMLVTMIVGVQQLEQDWAEYEQMRYYVSYLNKENARLTQEYSVSYDIADIQSKAVALGMVDVSELQRRSVTVTVPEPEPTVSRVDEIKWYLEEMFA